MFVVSKFVPPPDILGPYASYKTFSWHQYLISILILYSSTVYCDSCLSKWTLENEMC